MTICRRRRSDRRLTAMSRGRVVWWTHVPGHCHAPCNRLGTADYVVVDRTAYLIVRRWRVHWLELELVEQPRIVRGNVLKSNHVVLGREWRVIANYGFVQQVLLECLRVKQKKPGFLCT